MSNLDWIDDLGDEKNEGYYERAYKGLDQLLDDPRCPYDLDYIYNWIKDSLDKNLDDDLKAIVK